MNLPDIKKFPLESINLAGCQLMDEGLEYLLEKLQKNPVVFANLRSINVKMNRLTVKSGEILSQFIRNFKNNGSLLVIDA